MTEEEKLFKKTGRQGHRGMYRGKRRNENVRYSMEGDICVWTPMDKERYCSLCEKMVPTDKFGWYTRRRKDGSVIKCKKPVCNPCNAERVKSKYRNSEEQRQKNCFNARVYNIKKVYGLTYDEYLAMIASREGVCDLCSGKSEKLLNVDHCHITGKVRGLLCLHCNMALSKFRDSVTFLRKAIAYLQKNDPYFATSRSEIIPLPVDDLISRYANDCEWV